VDLIPTFSLPSRMPPRLTSMSSHVAEVQS
jgi:hypothetical protein